MKLILFILCILAPSYSHGTGDDFSHQMIQQRPLPLTLIRPHREILFDQNANEAATQELRRLTNRILNLEVERNDLKQVNAEMQKLIDSSATEMFGQYVNNYLLIRYFEEFLLEHNLKLPLAVKEVKASQEAEFIRLGFDMDSYLTSPEQQAQDQSQTEE